MSDDNAFEQRRVWPNEAQPRWPVFAPYQPPASPVATSISNADVVMVSLDGAAPAPMSFDHFAAFMKDGRTDGQVHVSQPDGTLKTASFALFRAFIYGHDGHSAAKS